MKKRILITANHFYPYKGGLENYVLELGKRLSQKFEVHILTSKHTNLRTEEIIQGLRVHRLEVKEFLSNTYPLPNKSSKKYKKTLNHIKKLDYHAIITNTRFFPTTKIGLQVAQEKGIKLIHIEHGNRHVTHKNPLVVILAWITDQTLGRKVLKNANTTIAISNAGRKFCEKLGAKKIVVIPNSINPREFLKAKTNLKNKLNIPKNHRIIVNGIGRLVHSKGPQDTIIAARGIKNVTVVTPGDGTYKDSLKKLAKEKNVNAIFLGEIPREHVKDVLSIADIFVNPSYSEGLPTCVLEAGTMGVPTIATDVGGTREIIKNKSYGYLVQSKNPEAIRRCILDILNNKKEAQEKAKKLKEHIQKEFNWENNIKKLERIIEK